MDAKTVKITESDKLNYNLAWLAAEQDHEISRLEAIRRNARATAEDIRIATAMLDYWRTKLK